MSQIEVVLRWKKDKTGQSYLVGQTDLPAMVDFTNLIIFVWPNPPESDDVPAMVIKNRSDAEDWQRSKEAVMPHKEKKEVQNGDPNR